MIFSEFFNKSTEAHGQSAAHALSPSVDAKASVYDEGLVTLLDEKLGSAALSGWKWLLGEDSIALASTWLGNLIFFSTKHKASFYLEVQRGKTTFIDRDIGYLFNEFMTSDGVKEKFLDIDKFALVRQRLGPLKYGECYIPEPWPMLGGNGLPDSYGKGDLEVYLNLVGQTIKRQMGVA